jgi:hypothetical protein
MLNGPILKREQIDDYAFWFPKKVSLIFNKQRIYIGVNRRVNKVLLRVSSPDISNVLSFYVHQVVCVICINRRFNLKYSLVIDTEIGRII